MTTTTTTTTTTHKKFARTVHLDFYNAERGVTGITIREGKKVNAYLVESTPHSQLLAYLIMKVSESDQEVYGVEIDPRYGFDSCSCRGWVAHGHCKHVSALLALHGRGKI